MAADSLTTAGDAVVTKRARKIHRAKGCLVGMCGYLGDELLFLRWFSDGHDLDNRPKLGDSFGAVVMGPRGLFKYWEDCVPIEQVEPYATTGSGWSYALSALMLGKTPVEAVRHAMQMDIATGGRVRCQYL